MSGERDELVDALAQNASNLSLALSDEQRRTSSLESENAALRKERDSFKLAAEAEAEARIAERAEALKEAERLRGELDREKEEHDSNLESLDGCHKIIGRLSARLAQAEEALKLAEALKDQALKAAIYLRNRALAMPDLDAAIKAWNQRALSSTPPPSPATTEEPKPGYPAMFLCCSDRTCNGECLPPGDTSHEPKEEA